MSAERNFSPDEYELLSAYLDNMLNEAERTALEVRLAGDDALRAELEALRNTVSLIKSLPVLKAPRNFTLTPEMVKSRTEPSSPSMVKSRTEPSSPTMSKSRTEPGRIIRFPISTVMSAAASFVFIIIGLLLLTNGQILPTATPPPINRAVENVDVAMQQEQPDIIMPASAQIITEETAEQESANMDAISQRAMPTATFASVTTGMMPMPTPTLSVMMTQSAMAQPNQPQMPTTMAMDMTATMNAESFAESAPAMPFAPTENSTLGTIDVPPVDDVQDMMADVTTMSMVTSPEITPIAAIIEIMGNAIPPTGTVDNVLYDVNQQGGMTAFAITPTPDMPVFQPRPDSPSSIDITALIGIALVIIGIVVFIVTLWRWRKG